MWRHLRATVVRAPVGVNVRRQPLPPMPIEKTVKLPPLEERSVLGVWRLPPPIPCTRTIELVDNNYFMVARCHSKEAKKKKEPPAPDGSLGVPLVRISDTEYEATGTRYRIASGGRLIAFRDAEVLFECEPQGDIWP